MQRRIGGGTGRCRHGRLEMLTVDDAPTIKNATIKRLDKERGVAVHEVYVGKGDGCVRIGVLCVLNRHIQVRSLFELPTEFDYRHLHNEIDQIAEQCKAAVKDFWSRGRPEKVENVPLRGTGLRGLWAVHA